MAIKFTRRQVAFGVSILFHALLAVVLLVWYVPRIQHGDGPSQQASRSTEENAEPDAAENASPAKLSQLADEPAEVSDEQVERSIESQVDAASKLSDEQKLSELEKNLQRLEKIADSKSVQKVSEKIAGTMGLDVDQYAEKPKPVGGTFNVDTSQLSEVRRTRRDDGGWSYESVMLDADGREMVVPLSEAEGESLFETFQLMKQYPMANGIYRSVVMPMMQKILEAQAMEFELPEAPPVDPVVELPETPGDLREIP